MINPTHELNRIEFIYHATDLAPSESTNERSFTYILYGHQAQKFHKLFKESDRKLQFIHDTLHYSLSETCELGSNEDTFYRRQVIECMKIVKDLIDG